METLEETGAGSQKIPNHYRPTRTTLALGLLAVILIVGTSLQSVRVAGKGQNDARSELQSSQEKIDKLQNQIDCTIRILTSVSSANLQNAIAQDDMLLGGFSGGDTSIYIKILKDNRERLATIATDVATVDEQCKPKDGND